MIRINVKEVLAKAEEAKKNPLRPAIRLISSPPATKKQPRKQQPVPEPVEDGECKPQSELVKSLWSEYSALKNERNKLSTEIAHLVENGVDQVRLKAQYDKIESFRPQLQDLYDKIQYAEKHGDLPAVPVIQEEPETLASLKLKKEALIDERYKLKKKLAKKVAKNPQKYIDWELRLAQADIEFQSLIDQIKRMEGKA